MRSDLFREAEQKLQDERTNTETYVVNVNGKPFLVLPGVHSPKYFQGTSICSALVSRFVRNTSSFLEIGCGTGAISCFVASKYPNKRIVATDISHKATQNTRINSLLHNLECRIDVRTGSLFEPISCDERFDRIFWNMPIIDAEMGDDPYAISISDPNYEVFGQFLNKGQDYLSQNGALMFSFSREWGNYTLMKELCKRAGLAQRLLASVPYYKTGEKVGVDFELRIAKPIRSKK